MDNKIDYKEEYIKNEVIDRVEFKLNDINDIINNHLRRTVCLPVDSNHMIMEKMIRNKVFKEIKEIFDKEKNMSPPYDEMYVRRKGAQRDKSIDNIMNRFDEMTRGICMHPAKRHSFIQLLVKNIKNSQI